MAVAKKADVSIEIQRMNIQSAEFSIVGTTPLIVHAWSEKAKRQMLDKQQKKATKAKHDIKIPYNDLIDSAYWLTDKPEHGTDDESAEANWYKALEDGAKFGFPLSGIKQSIISGGYRAGMDVKMTELRGSFFLRGATDAATFDNAEIIYTTDPVCREDMVRVGGMSKTADIRYRIEFPTWEIPLVMEYNGNGKYSLEQLLNLVNYGGFVSGLGEWRPEHDGQFGMYQLKA